MPDKLSDEWKGPFLRRLEADGNVAAACRSAGVSRSHAYRMRAIDPEFEQEWGDAIEALADDLEAKLVTIGRDGRTKVRYVRCGTDPNTGFPVYERITETVHDVAAILARLRALRPESYKANYPLKEIVAGVAAHMEEQAEWRRQYAKE